MRYAPLLVCLSFTTYHSPLTAQLPAADWQFPAGVPLKATEITWYNSSDEFQMFDGVLPGFHSIANTSWSWNREFPWRTGGLDRSTNATTFKFHQLAGPVQHYRERGRFFANANVPGYHRWKFAPGSIFGEVIQVDGRTTEIGMITITEQEPRFRLFRPFGSRDEIKEWILWEATKLGTVRNTHPTPILNETGLLHDIELSPEGVKAILARPFRDVTDVVFSERAGRKAFAPTTRQRHSVVPQNSDRGLFSSQACLKCHRTAGQEGRLLDPNPSPDKYGAIRGGHGIFSFRPRP